MVTFLNVLNCCLCFHFIVLDAKELHFEAHSSILFDNFVEHKSRYLDVSKHSETRVREFADCAMDCLECSSCVSVNMASSPDDGEMFWCELLLADMFNNSQNFNKNATSHHFSKWSPCLKKPCLNRGSCVANYQDDTHRCLCEPGFAWKNCQLNLATDCFTNPVGVSDQAKIPDQHMTASSQYGDGYQPAYGRLNGDRGDGWCAKESARDDDWLQVDLGTTFQVCAVASQGDRNGNEWVTDFKLSYSSDGNVWTPYKDGNGVEMEFHRQGDSNTVDQHGLSVPVSARYFRFHPTKQHNFNCMRVELYSSTR
ncbi:lactadherin-like isoform X2 [Oculina patagonica]